MNHSYHSSFTPSMSDPETLEALFVVREKLANQIMSGIQESAKTDDKHQVMLVGSRGIGKTHLVALLNYRVKQDDTLAKLMRIAWLYEDPNLDDYKDLLILILQQLEKEYDLVEIGKQLEKILDLNDLDKAELALEQLLLDSIKEKTLLLISENFDDLLSDIKEIGQRKLRAFIQNNPYITILSTATSLIDAVTKRDQTFYGFFKVHTLSPFNTNEAIKLLVHLAKRTEKPVLVQAISSPMGKARISAVHYLAGGNPRIYVLFFDFLTRDSLDSLVQPLMKLIDDLTPYYQSRMARLSSLQRRIIDILCKLKGAVTIKQIARQAMKTSQTISSSLGELVTLGYVIQADSIGRSNYYEIREPLMRLCLEVKEQRGRNIELFVQFLRVWYSEKEMQGMLSEDCNGEDREYIQEAVQLAQTEPDPVVKSLESEFFKHSRTGDYQAALESAEISIERNPDDKSHWKHKCECLEQLFYPLDEQLVCWQKIVAIDLEDMWSWNRLALLFNKLGHMEEALQASTKALALKPDSSNIQHNHGYALKNVGRIEEAQEYFEKAIELTGEPTTAIQWDKRGGDLGRMGRESEALVAFSKALKLDPQYIKSWSHLLGILQEQGRYKLNLRILEQLVKFIPEQAKLQLFLGISSDDLGRHEQALKAYERTLEIYPELNHDEVKVALYQAKSLSFLSYHTEVLAVLEQCNDNSSQRNKFLHALLRAHTLMCLDSWEEGKAKLDSCLSEYSSNIWTGRDLTIISLLIEQNQNPHVWRRFIVIWLELFSKHDCLTLLGDGLVRRIRCFVIPFITNEVAYSWLEIWQELADKYEEMKLPLRLLKAGVEYKATQDSRVLLKLAREERQLLQPWLVNLFQEEVVETDQEMSNLMDIVEQKLIEEAEKKRIAALWQAPVPDLKQIDFDVLLSNYQKNTVDKPLYLLPGKWKALSILQAKKLLKLVVNCEDDGARGFSRKELQVINVERRSVSCSDWQLYQIHIEAAGLSGALDVLASKDDSKILDGQSPTTYTLLEKHVLKIDNSKQKMAYIRFFTSSLRAEGSRFHLVDTIEDLDIPLSEKDKLNIHPWSYKHINKEQSTYEGTLLFNSALFQAKLSLNDEPIGRVNMLADEPMDSTLPLPKEHFDGPFRFNQ